jgi:hypothetical protein
MVTLSVHAKQHESHGTTYVDVTLRNPSLSVAVMAHVQLRDAQTNERVLPVFYTDNYVSLLPGESRNIGIEAAAEDLKGHAPLVAVDGWNVTVDNSTNRGRGSVRVVANADAIRKTPTSPHPLNIHCGASWIGDYGTDIDFTGGTQRVTDAAVDVSTPNSGPAILYQYERRGPSDYAIPVPAGTYTVRLHFAENVFDHAGARQFNVLIGGKQVLTDFDIFAVAGAEHKAVVKDFTGITPDATGAITISFQTGSTDQPTVSGIQIIPG